MTDCEAAFEALRDNRDARVELDQARSSRSVGLLPSSSTPQHSLLVIVRPVVKLALATTSSSVLPHDRVLVVGACASCQGSNDLALFPRGDRFVEQQHHRIAPWPAGASGPECRDRGYWSYPRMQACGLRSYFSGPPSWGFLLTKCVSPARVQDGRWLSDPFAKQPDRRC